MYKNLRLTEFKVLMVELNENSLHSVIEELERWEFIIGEKYIDYKIEEGRNRLISIH